MSGNNQAINIKTITQDTEVNKLFSWFLFVCSLTLSIWILFYRLGELSIILWDESRLANNALEMVNSGLYWITTYDGTPDHWNTKPPLLIWLMSLSIYYLGASELSVRVPSVIAALATIVMLLAFATFYLKRPLIGFFAVLILLPNIEYIQTHGARSGNYEATLTLFTTSFLMSGYLYLKGNKHQTLWLSLCMLSIFLAFFTKTIQGMIFVPGLLIYALYQRQYCVLKSPLVYIYGILILVVCVAYYYLRNQIDPGYLESAISNDLFGRFGTILENHSGSPFYYLKHVWMILAVGIIGFQFKHRDNSDMSNFSVYLGVVFLFYLLIISAASTKLSWYVAPLAPLASMLIAIALYQLVENKLSKATVSGINPKTIILLTSILASVMIFAYNARYIETQEAASKILVADQYNYFLRSKFVGSGQIPKFAVVHPGYPSKDNKFYIAPALFYINILRKSMDVAVLQTNAVIPEDYKYLILCGNDIKNRIESEAILQAVEIEGQCGMYAITERKTKI